METKSERINRLAEETNYAYSVDAYTPSGWKGAIRFLISKECNDYEIKAVLFSKHMRWAGDCDEKRRYGNHNGSTLKEYFKKGFLSHMEIDQLVIGTFGSLNPKEEEC